MKFSERPKNYSGGYLHCSVLDTQFVKIDTIVFLAVKEV